jgi:hypothetical protein
LVAKLAQSRGRIFEYFDRRAATVAARATHRRVHGRQAAALRHVDLGAALDEKIDHVVPAPTRCAEQRRAAGATRDGAALQRSRVKVRAGVEQQR